MISERQATKLANVKRRQMEELERVLEEEERKDQERDRRLEGVRSVEEREALEVIFGKERAQT